MELSAPSRWQCVDFISDLHLQASAPQNFQAWRTYLQETAADAVFILGDLFEIWVGDDVLSLSAGFEKQCADTLRAAARRADLYIMRGNRDFLMGPALMAACNCHLLEDPSVLSFANQRWLLSHGDAWCIDDTEYLQFRAQVRSADWQQGFLARPLPERVELARSMRAQSEARKRADIGYADVDFATANAMLQSWQADHLIHGHTHRPARHALAAGRERWVLSDWDMDAAPARAEVLRLRRSTTGPTETFTLERIPPSMAIGSQKSRSTTAD